MESAAPLSATPLKTECAGLVVLALTTTMEAALPAALAPHLAKQALELMALAALPARPHLTVCAPLAPLLSSTRVAQVSPAPSAVPPAQ